MVIGRRSGFSEQLRQELVRYPDGPTDDGVLADWFGEHNLDRIVERARRRHVRFTPSAPDLPPYLRRQVVGVGNRRGTWSPPNPVGVR